MLGIPRPTLYRYLREYSIPHLRRAGRISIPEDSFDRIRAARDLHKEGLGTEVVRRQLRQGDVPDSGELDRRLDTLHKTVEDLRDDVSYSPSQRTILARQSLLMSAVFNLTEMVEDLLLASGKPRKRTYQDVETQEVLPESQASARPGIPGKVTPGREPLRAAPDHNAGGALALRPTDFGALRRRRRGVLTILTALALAGCVTWAMVILSNTSHTGSPVPRVSETAAGPPEAPKVQNGAADGAAPNKRAAIPDVSGQELEKAIQTISGAGFEVSAIKSRTSQRPPETAIQTNPAAGATTEAGAPITLILSDGPANIAPTTATSTAAATASPASVN